MVRIGYTHCWDLKVRPKRKDLEKALNYVKRVIEKYRGLVQFEGDNSGEPVITKELIRFNGVGESGHETFYFEFPPTKQEWQTVGKGFLFGFCKTARKPYDIVVCECLLILKAFLGDDMKLSSDGFSNDIKKFDGVWDEAIREVGEMGFDVKTKVERRKGTPYFDCEIIEVCRPSVIN